MVDFGTNTTMQALHWPVHVHGLSNEAWQGLLGNSGEPHPWAGTR